MKLNTITLVVLLSMSASAQSASPVRATHIPAPAHATPPAHAIAHAAPPSVQQTIANKAQSQKVQKAQQLKKQQTSKNAKKK